MIGNSKEIKLRLEQNMFVPSSELAVLLGLNYTGRGYKNTTQLVIIRSILSPVERKQ